MSVLNKVKFNVNVNVNGKVCLDGASLKKPHVNILVSDFNVISIYWIIFYVLDHWCQTSCLWFETKDLIDIVACFWR